MEDRPQGLCRAKKLYFLTTAGGPFLPDFGFRYVEALAKNFYGIPEVVCIHAEGLDIDGADIGAIMQKALAEIDAL